MRRQIWGKAIIFFLIILIIALAAFCCIKAKDWNSNLVSMISGLWSAIATFAVGIIAYLQSKKYKVLADKTEDQYNAPEFFIPSGPDTISGLNYPWNIKQIVGCGQAENENSTTFDFLSLDKPILGIEPKEIWINEEKQEIHILSKRGIDVFHANSRFRVGIKSYKEYDDGLYDFKLCIQYENIYGTKYRKIYSSKANIDHGIISINYPATLTRAERVF